MTTIATYRQKKAAQRRFFREHAKDKRVRLMGGPGEWRVVR